MFKDLTPEKVAWMVLIATIGLAVFLIKNVWIAELSVRISVLLLIPMLGVKLVTGYVFVPVRDAVLARTETPIARYLVKCFVYAVDMSFGWAVTAIFFVEWSRFPSALMFTFVTSFLVEPLVERVQRKLQGQIESTGALFPLLRKR
jgi:hypothetical protein